MIISGEILLLIGVFGGLFIAGIAPVIFKVRSEKRPSKWAYKVPTEAVKTNLSVSSPLQLAGVAQQQSNEVGDYELTDYTPVLEEVQTNFNSGFNYEDSEINYNHSVLSPEMLYNIQKLTDSVSPNEGQETDVTYGTVSDKLINDVTEKVGRITASLVTTDLANLELDKLSIVIGYFNKEFNTVAYDNTVYKLSYKQQIMQADGELLILKGSLLPSNVFRVIAWDDPYNVEAGYDVETYVLNDQVAQ